MDNSKAIGKGNLDILSASCNKVLIQTRTIQTGASAISALHIQQPAEIAGGLMNLTIHVQRGFFVERQN
jgi:hypothetical protein